MVVTRIRNSQRFPDLMDAPVFAGLDLRLVVSVIDSARVVYYENRTEFLVQGDLPDGMFVVAQGTAEVVTVSESGDLVPLLIAGNGMALGLIEALGETGCAASCYSSPGMAAIVVAPQTLFDLTRERAFIRNFAGTIFEALQRFNTYRIADTLLPADKRVCRYLTELSRTSDTIAQSQGFISHAAGCSRQTVNRVLGELREAGIVSIDRRGIHVLDRAALGLRATLKED